MKTCRAAVRSLLVAAVALSCALDVVLAAAPSAWADASGCTWAPGGFAAQQCINVHGSGLYVSWVANQYFASPTSGWAANVCNRKHENKFTNPNGTIGYWEADLSSCILGSVAVTTGDYVTWSPNRRFYDGRGMCARSNNSDTGGTWSPYACETIHS
jgi:hypothetical protein